jgi:hypothetical protein
MVALIALSPCRLASVWVAAKKLRANPFLRLSNSAEGGDVADVVRQVLRPDERLKSPQAAVALLSHEATDHPTAHQHALGQTPRRKWLLKRCRPAPGDGLVEKARKRRRIRCSATNLTNMITPRVCPDRSGCDPIRDKVGLCVCRHCLARIRILCYSGCGAASVRLSRVQRNRRPRSEGEIFYLNRL